MIGVIVDSLVMDIIDSVPSNVLGYLKIFQYICFQGNLLPKKHILPNYPILVAKMSSLSYGHLELCPYLEKGVAVLAMFGNV